MNETAATVLLAQSSGSNAVDVADWIIATGLIVGSLLVIVLLRRVVQSLSHSMPAESFVVTIVTRFVGTIIVLIAIVYALRQLQVEVGPLIGALGIGGFVVALSLQHVLGNFVGSILLHARRPIKRGDQIHTNGYSGTVIEINGRSVVLLTFNGETVYVPNLKVLDEALVNQTSEPFRRTVLPFEVSYDADLRHTQHLLVKALRNLEALADSPSADVAVEGFGESGVSMVARFWHPSEELTARWVTAEVAITIRETLAAHDITIPYPQRVLHISPGDPIITPDASIDSRRPADADHRSPADGDR